MIDIMNYLIREPYSKMSMGRNAVSTGVIVRFYFKDFMQVIFL